MGTIKRFHLDIDTADLSKGMSIGSGACRDSKGAPQLVGPPVGLRLGPAIDDLDDVDARRDALDRLLTQMAAGDVIRMFEVDEPALLLDGGDRFLRRQSAGDGRIQEQPDELAFRGQNLLSDDRELTGINEGLRPVDSIVIGQDDGGEAKLPAATSDLKWRHPAIKGGRAVQVHVHPNSGASCTSGHVRYYRAGRGLREGSDTSEGWLLSGKQRLNSRAKASLWN